MPSDKTTDDMVHESALQLWAAAQTDFDPFEVPAEEWSGDTVPVRDADIAHDTGLSSTSYAMRCAAWTARGWWCGRTRRPGRHPGHSGRRAPLREGYSPSIRPMISFWSSVVHHFAMDEEGVDVPALSRSTQSLTKTRGIRPNRCASSRR